MRLSLNFNYMANELQVLRDYIKKNGLKDTSQREEILAHLLRAELALQSSDYLEAAQEYRKAAELSSSVDVARQATKVGYSFGFNKEALRSAKRWQELDKDSDEALLYVAQLQAHFYHRTPGALFVSLLIQASLSACSLR